MRFPRPLLIICSVALIVGAAVFYLNRRSSGIILEEWKGHVNGIGEVDWSPDGRYIASGGDDQTVRLWDAHSGYSLMNMPRIFGRITSLAFSPDSRILAAGSNAGFLRLWEVPTGSRLAIPWVRHGYVTEIAFTTDGKQMATGGHDRTVMIWDLQRLRPLKLIRGFSKWVGALSFSPNGETLAVGDYDGIRLFRTHDRKEINRIRSGRVHWILYSSDGQSLAVGNDMTDAEILDSKTLERIRKLPGTQASSAGISRDGETLATTDGYVLKVWELPSGREKARLVGRTGLNAPAWTWKFAPFLRTPPPVFSYDIAFSPDGDALAAACVDGAVRVWRNLPN